MPKRVLPPNHEQNLQDALLDLKKDPTLSIARAAGRRAVSKSTLRDRVNKGRQASISAHTHEYLLSPAQEDALVKWALFQDDMGIPPRQELLKEKAEAILHITNSDKKIGKHWIERFMKRHKELQMKFTQRLDRQRAAAGNPKIMEKHFSIFKKAVKDYKVKNVNIWNMDEKGFLMGLAAKAKVICRRGRRNPRYTCDGSRELITVLECVSAEGHLLPPMIVTKGAHHYSGNHVRGQGTPGSVYGYSPKGWTTNELGLEWLEHHYEPLTRPEYITLNLVLFINYDIIANRRFRHASDWRLLVLDGHESHANYSFLDFAWRHRILVQVLPAHSSHLTQPLDVGLFSPLQNNYGKLVMDWSKGGGFPGLHKSDFFPLLKIAREQTYTPKNIKSAWMGAGLVPYDKQKILSRLGGPPMSNTPDNPQEGLQTPRNPRQFRSFMIQTEHMMESEGVGELVIKTIRTLAKLSLQEQAMGAVVEHEAKQLRGRLKMKDGHKKSRVRLVKVNMSNGILITNEEIDQLKLQLEEKEALAAEKQLRAEAKKLRQSKKQLAIPRPRRQKKVSFASVQSIEFHVLTDTG
jgi:hypothetical protein